ncbi:DUF2158 domain-containing protein [Sphingobium amiense]|uniref:DUF2158 domain-containing protein n=3 Tax=Sphingobium amiense TaxID=135719 RepID=A0A494WDS7_9SPHN|nr:DUF2158 domain-containing protein [Sphingobium amiense]
MVSPIETTNPAPIGWRQSIRSLDGSRKNWGLSPKVTSLHIRFWITIEQSANLEEIMSFEPGDVVRLKSGGPLMTVEQVGTAAMTGEDTVWCVWFEKIGNRQARQEATFRPSSLEKRSPSYGGSFSVSRA